VIKRFCQKSTRTILISGLIKCADRGFALRATDIQTVVQTFLNRNGRNVSRFKAKIYPMLIGFVCFCHGRNKSLTKRSDENIKRVRAGISKPILKQYFDNLEEVL